jgi:hypothetical protein
LHHQSRRRIAREQGNNIPDGKHSMTLPKSVMVSLLLLVQHQAPCLLEMTPGNLALFFFSTWCECKAWLAGAFDFSQTSQQSLAAN